MGMLGKVTFVPWSGHGPAARWWPGDCRGQRGQSQRRTEGKGQLSKVCWTTIQKNAVLFGNSDRDKVCVCVFLEQCTRMQISICLMTLSVLWMLRWAGTSLRSKSCCQHLTVVCEKKLAVFHVISSLQVYLWTSEEEASYPGYSSATVSKGCRSDRRLKGGVSLSFDLKYKISATLLGTLM